MPDVGTEAPRPKGCESGVCPGVSETLTLFPTSCCTGTGELFSFDFRW